MNYYQEYVRDFHRATNGTVGETPEMRDNLLRAKLIMEEAVETVAAMGFAAEGHVYPHYEGDPAERSDVLQVEPLSYSFARERTSPDFAEAIDGLADLLYVTFGTAVAWGIDLDEFFAAVHMANMRKLDGPVRADGKQLKPEGWQPPDIEGILARQVSSAA